LVIPPVAHLAKATGKFSMTGIVIAGAFGSWVGATAMYWVSRLAGRPFVLRYGRYVFITPDKVEGAERWATQFGAWSSSPASCRSRHLIGIPAGTSR
jgi:membrane protein DedA with SNARE-associated domain